MTTARFALRRTDPPAGGLLLARLRQYRRRLWLGRIVRNSLALGYWSAVVAVAAAGVLVFFPAVETLETVLILVAVGLAAGAVLGFFARPSLQSAAIATDLAARSREQLSTALELAQAPDLAGFSRLVLGRAATVAQGLEPRRVLPLTVPKHWRWTAGLTALACALAFVPRCDLAALRRGRQERRHLAQAFQVLRKRRIVEHLAGQARQQKDPELARMAQELQKLQRRLEQQQLKREEAVARLTALIERLRGRREEAEAARRLAEKLRELVVGGRAPDSVGAAATAREAARQLAKELAQRSLTEEQLKQLAQAAQKVASMKSARPGEPGAQGEGSPGAGESLRAATGDGGAGGLAAAAQQFLAALEAGDFPEAADQLAAVGRLLSAEVQLELSAQQMAVLLEGLEESRAFAGGLEPGTYAGAGLRIRPAGRSRWVGGSGRGWRRGLAYTGGGHGPEWGTGTTNLDGGPGPQATPLSEHKGRQAPGSRPYQTVSGEFIYAPSLVKGQAKDARVRGAMGKGPSVVIREELGRTAPREQAYVPVTQVLAQYQREAERALEDERIPADYQHYVRHYFDSWVSDLQGAGGPTGPQPGEGPSSENGQP